MKKIIIIFCTTALFLTEGSVFPENLPDKPEPLRSGSRYSVTWGGHSTAMININGKKILTDPFLSDRVAGITKRTAKCKLDFSVSGRPDIILISHSHFDHLCMNSLEILENKFSGADIVFPEGVENYLPDLNFRMHRLRTNNNFRNTVLGESVTIDNVKITSVYAKHSGGRYGIDSYFWKDKGHTGYIIEYEGVTVYFSGDTGYDDKAFKELGKLFDIDAALIQTGPCLDCDGEGTDEHASSIEALNIFSDLNASYMIPVHFGSIEYDNSADFPVYVLREIINRKYNMLATAGSTADNQVSLLPYRIIILEEGGSTYLLNTD